MQGATLRNLTVLKTLCLRPWGAALSNWKKQSDWATTPTGLSKDKIKSHSRWIHSSTLNDDD